ncbi:MAG: ShlB/FhaC/HecB family hemolysin secretion/activation protein [Opitutae bacterium]|nr:ShlB/FhaC/HecB family hemolysin secretion/activation protein [Opitutae bacterium]
MGTLRFTRFLFLCIIAVTAAYAQSQAITATPTRQLKRLYIADTEAKVLALQPAPTDESVVVQGVEVLATKEFAAFIAAFIGQPITAELLNRLASEIGIYMQKHDRPVVSLQIPSQSIATGEFRIVVTVGRYNQLKFTGNRWFSRELLESKLGIKPGDEIRLSTLEEAVNWSNTNPFRHIQVVLNNLPTQTAARELVILTQERIPVRVAAVYDNTGTALLGENHYSAALQLGNVWGQDHQLSYQFTTTDQSSVFQSHSADYRVPLPWRHYLQATTAYGFQRPSFEDGLFSLKGESSVADLRYIVPLERGAWSHEFSLGLDFKRTNNNLEFGGWQVFGSKSDTWQVTVGSTTVHRDTSGSWAVSLNLNASPGGINVRNTDEALSQVRYGAKARYLAGSLLVQRFTRLPAGFQLFSRGQLQCSSTNLIGNEQLSIGGQGSVRGYDERIFSGDQGWVLSNECQSPSLNKALSSSPKKYPPLQTRFLVFWDYARVAYKHRFFSDIKLDPLMSVGIGVRCNLATNFSLSADYGWQLLKTTRPQPTHGRGHIRATIAY